MLHYTYTHTVGYILPQILNFCPFLQIDSLKKIIQCNSHFFGLCFSDYIVEIADLSTIFKWENYILKSKKHVTEKGSLSVLFSC